MIELPETALPATYGAYSQLRVSRLESVVAIGLQRPEKRNAIGVEMTLEIEQVVQALLQDVEVKAVLVYGIGGHFCAGMDMKDFFDQSERSAETLRQARAATDNWRARLLRHLPQAIVVAVEGYCLGGAWPILECASVVLAAEGATFGLPEINFGFVPGGPIAKSAGSALTVRGASYAALTGRPFDARQALKWGLVTQVIAASELPIEALRLAREITVSPFFSRHHETT